MSWDINGNSGTDPASNFLGTRDNQPFVVKTNNSEALRINGDGGQSSKVEIAAQDGLSINGFQPFITLRDANAVNARSCMQGVDGDIVIIPNSFVGTGAAMVIKTGSGNVGIGTSTPSSKVEIIAQDGLAVSGFQPFITLRDTNGGNARACVQGVDGDIVIIPNSFVGTGAAMVIKTGSGNVGIGTSTPSEKLHVEGTAFAFDFVVPNSDCAEEFDVDASGEVDPGDVVVIGEREQMRLCRDAYDRRVAGVISGAGDCRPGVVLGRRTSTHPRMAVALSGMVWCKVDAEEEPVDVGDLLTTSATPGHAMKAIDPLKAFGAVIGKALHPLAGIQGLIPVLIALQ
jgi:hypothetical protein